MKIAIVASGLGIVHRGFESSAAIWARTLRGIPGVEIMLYGGGSYPGAARLSCIHQKSLPVRIATKLGLARDGARIQQLSIFPALTRALRKFRPDYIWLQEWSLAKKLQSWIRRENFPAEVVFCNGAPAGVRDCLMFDRVISLHPQAERELMELGYPVARRAVIPYPVQFQIENGSNSELRSHYGLPADRYMVLCAAAWNRHHKRIDYLIREVAACGRKDVHLLLCGQPEADTLYLKELAAVRLPGYCTWLTLPAESMPDAYAIADWFVLPSLSEGLGAVLIEAAMAGLGIYAHRMPPAEFILGGDYPGLLDLSVEGALAHRLGNHDARFARDFLEEKSVSVRKRFSPEVLGERLVEFLNDGRNV